MTMKNLFLAISYLFIAVMFSGCGAAKVGKAVVDDQINQFEQYLKDKTVLPRANVQLTEAKQSRSNLDKLAKQRRVDVEVSKRLVQPLEEEAAISTKAFETLQEIARAGGLPKKIEATEADMNKQFQVAGQSKSGSDIYRMLQQYKDEARKINDKINREKTKQAFLSRQAEQVEGQLRSIDNHIDDLERQIEDYKLYQELYAANQAIADLNLPTGKVDQLLKTDSMIEELKKLNLTSGIIIEQDTKTQSADDIKDALTGGGFSITSDDLL